MRDFHRAEFPMNGAEPPLSDPGRGYEEVRADMEAAYEAAQREHAPLAVLCVAIDGLERTAYAAGVGADAVVASVTAALCELPRDFELLAYQEGHETLVLLPRASRQVVDAFARGLATAVKRLPLPGLAAPVSARVSVGLAFAQYDGAYWLETLLSVARDGAEVAASSGGAAVHTELYAFHQSRLEKLHPDWSRPILPPPPPAQAEQAWTAAKPVATKVPESPPASPKELERPPAAPAEATPSVEDLERRVLSLAREWTEENLAKALAEQQKVHSSKVEILERRINKLMGALESTQAELERRNAGAEIDPGVASVYRTVQGLRWDASITAKLDMLAKLVEMNLALRAQFKERH